MNDHRPTHALPLHADTGTGTGTRSHGDLHGDLHRWTSRHAARALTAAFAVSAAYAVWARTEQLVSPADLVGNLAVCAVGLGLAALLRRRPTRVVRAAALGVVVLLLAIGVFVYPDQFVPARQTWLGWLENDAYMGLLSVAAYLLVAGWRRT